MVAFFGKMIKQSNDKKTGGMRVKLLEDAPVVSIAEQISEVIIAGFLWLIACIPIITIGPASAALYYTIVKVVRKKT